ncbi:MAG: XdhC family protein [Pseudomonadota bacterium]
MAFAHDQMPEQALDWHRSGKGAVIATVVETWGSAPRPVGSQLVISGEAELAGSVSGGCVEGAVVAEALDAVESGAASSMKFGVSDDEAFAVGLACGGEIRVIVEPVGAHISEDVLAELVDARAARAPIALAVNPATWERRLVRPGSDDPLAIPLETRARADKSGFEGDWFLGLHNPPLRMVVVGAVHIAQPLLTMARLAGYDPVLVDPREAFGSESRFPGETILHDWPDAALTAHGLDARTAVVTLTHDPKLDDPAIEVALGAECFYLGCLGSTRTHGKRVTRLEAAGFSAEQISKIHAPVGLDIGAKSPAEIAIAIMAEITARLRQP